MFSIGYPADEHYLSVDGLGNPAYENAKQVAATKNNANGNPIVSSRKKLVNLYACNTSAATVWLVLRDTADGGVDGGPSRVYPVNPLGFVTVAMFGGIRMEKGIHVQAFTDATLATPAGNVMYYAVDYTAYA